ncbi:hypothetical protein FIM12_08100 [SAR202 cluster bacterium AD-804-J14_MRT_500m]|nr:hypothetical protein [SAR202 cluster bacterium AD-804-J14_MRT_500m]
MKSAFEKAMERVEQLDRPDENQLLEWKLFPQGEKLAGDFLKGSGSPFTVIDNANSEHRPYIVQGMLKVLVANVQLPKSEHVRVSVEKVLGGIDRLLGSKANSKDLVERARYVTTQYWENAIPQREQAFAQLKMQMEQQVAEAMRRHPGAAPPRNLNIETMPEFQQQWIAVSGQIDQQYEQHLSEYRTQIMAIVQNG